MIHQFIAWDDLFSVFRSGTRVLHFIGLAFGVGAATVVDLIVLRFFIVGRIKAEHAAVVEFASKIVLFGLGLLWVSGLLFLIQYSFLDPSKLDNPKIFAKITIVLILTINGVFVHRIVLPLVHARVGRALLDQLPPRERVPLLALGVVSAMSWYVPLLLGATPQLNFVVPAWVILAAYAFAICAAVAAAEGIARLALGGRFVPVIRAWAAFRQLVELQVRIGAMSVRGSSLALVAALAVGAPTLTGTFMYGPHSGPALVLSDDSTPLVSAAMQLARDEDSGLIALTETDENGRAADRAMSFGVQQRSGTEIATQNHETSTGSASDGAARTLSSAQAPLHAALTPVVASFRMPMTREPPPATPSVRENRVAMRGTAQSRGRQDPSKMTDAMRRATGAPLQLTGR